MKTSILAVAIATAGLIAPSAAQAQPEATNPFEFTCAQLLDTPSDDDRVRANMMVYWSVGYMYGRLGGPDAPLQEANYQQATADMVGAFRQICPNVPDLPIAAFAENLANDFERQMQE